jgi:hypothetical protein
MKRKFDRFRDVEMEVKKDKNLFVEHWGIIKLDERRCHCC